MYHISRFLFPHKTHLFHWFISDGVSVYMHVANTPIFLYRYFKPHVYLFNLIFILYEYSFVGSDPRLYLYVQVLLSYVQIYLYVSTLIYGSIVFQT